MTVDETGWRYTLLCSFLFLLFIKITGAINDSSTCPYRRHQIHKRQASGAFAETLYEPSTPILQLNAKNFDNEVFNKNKPPKPHLVEFYLSWCGHCRNFAPYYVKFAENVKDWNSLVEVSAINCALDYNRDICDANRVEMVPYLRYFKRDAKEYDDAIVGLVAHRSADQLRSQLARLVLEEYEQHYYPDWPSFQYMANSISRPSETWTQVPSVTKYVVFIFEHPSMDSYISVEIILDMFPHYPAIVVKRVRDDHPLVKTWRIINFPSIAVLFRGNDNPVYLSEFRQIEVNNVLSKLTSSMPSKMHQPWSPIIAPALSTPPIMIGTPETPESRQAKYYVSETDLLLAAHYALTMEVPYISKNIVGSNFTKLTRFVNTLKKYFPKSRSVIEMLKFLNMPTGEKLHRSERARRFFSDLSDYLVSKHSIGSVRADEWKEKISELEARHDFPFPKDTNWQHCRGSKGQYRGYTCGLWTLFHTLTVDAYLEDGLKPGFDPFEVLEAITGYIGTYFGCTYCSRHFMQMVNGNLRMEDWVKYSSDVVMYLWRAHNAVNKRLAGDSTEDPDYPKYQFPPDFLCHDCQQQQYGQSDWSYRTVLRYLISYYTSIRPHMEEAH